jgi:sigma-B regulation protein RsbU (phosphoserine phosphatase)
MQSGVFANPGSAGVGDKLSLDDDLTTAKILVVDDSRTIRALITGHLRANGFTNLLAVADGNEALQATATYRPELIITDLLMPNLDGFDLCRLLRKNPDTRGIPVLAQTASTDPDLRAHAFESGATDLLPKPFDPRELLSRVRVLLERGRLIERLSEFQRHIAEELLQASAIQEALLPSDALLDRLKGMFPLDVAGHYQSSVGIGGDIWGLEQIDDRKLLIFNADFAGHGVGAALNTVRLHSFIQSTPDKTPVPSILLAELNRFLCEVLPTGQFATMFCALIDFESRIIDYSSAAAPPQLLRGAAGQRFEVIEVAGFPLGVTRDATYENRVAPFSPGGMLVLFSDALIETPPPPESAFTPLTLCDFANSLPPDIRPRQLCDRLLKELFERASEKPSDDLTLIAVQHMKQEDFP